MSEKFSVTFILPTGEEKTVQAAAGENLLEVAHMHKIPLEGACEGQLACSTCHLIVKNPSYFNKLSDATDEEEDMLDYAFGLTSTSRLGCQIIMCKELDGIVVEIPKATRNMMT